MANVVAASGRMRHGDAGDGGTERGMELRVLRYFLAAAEEGSVTGGAELLRISQPTMSRQLQQLERELGVTLFERGQRSITLTPEGMLLRDRARALVELADKTISDVSNRSAGELDGEIAICCGELRGVDWIAERMAVFRARHPRVRFALFSATADVMQERLEQGLSDVAVMGGAIDAERFGFLNLPQADRWGVMMRDDDPLSGLDGITPDDLGGREVLMQYRPQVRGMLDNWFGGVRDEITVSGTYNLPLNAAIAVRHGLGVALCIDVGQVGEGLRFVPLTPHLDVPSVVVWKRNRTLNPSAAAFVEFLRSGGSI
ncbi:LysR family transcriptional regulator [Bifidobacterium aerophilum]|uniref:LysR family transcriptional regulator n=1 Tax=Bifidobacterium aerophilum TaxID=1798155 RepID=A0A6N9Z745_9BIFI|nr:LysR family transcriptional regulator [Bifidobacterium aerophilum]NEG90276.1 LysR family transcriptional regulator [Bifidobacterium aerophilum]